TAPAPRRHRRLPDSRCIRCPTASWRGESCAAWRANRQRSKHAASYAPSTIETETGRHRDRGGRFAHAEFTLLLPALAEPGPSGCQIEPHGARHVTSHSLRFDEEAELPHRLSSGQVVA